MSIDAMKQAFKTVYGHEPTEDSFLWAGFQEGYRAAIEAAEKVEPVKFLCNGTRFKTYLTTDRGVVLEGLPRELSGMWVALVEATDDCHMLSTTPQPAIPAGWQLVPEKITEKMIDSMNSVKTKNPFWTYQDAYKAMLAAAPKE